MITLIIPHISGFSYMTQIWASHNRASSEISRLDPIFYESGDTATARGTMALIRAKINCVR